MTSPLNNLTDTWNNAGTVFNAIKYNISNGAGGAPVSAAGSKLFDYQFNGSTAYNLDKDGTATFTFGGNTGTFSFNSAVNNAFNFSNSVSVANIGYFSGGAGSFQLGSGIQFGFTNGSNISGTFDTILVRDAAGIFAQRNGTNAQALRVYNTVDAFPTTTNYERGVFDWTTNANVLTIAAQQGGTGTLRPLQFDASQLRFKINTGAPACNYDNNGFYPINNGQNMDLGFNGGAFSFRHLTIFGRIQWDNAGTIDTGITRTAAASIAFGNGTASDASATFVAKTKAGAFTTSDVPAGNWVLGRDTSGATTKLYYNNAGTLMVVALV